MAPKTGHMPKKTLEAKALAADSVEEKKVPVESPTEEVSAGEVCVEEAFALADITEADLNQMQNDLRWARKREREHRLRAEQAETKYDRMLAYVASLKKDLAGSTMREKELQAEVAALMKEKKAAAALSTELDKVKAAAWHDYGLAVEAEANARAEIENLRQQLLANSITPKTVADVAREREEEEARRLEARKVLEQKQSAEEIQNKEHPKAKVHAPVDKAQEKKKSKKNVKKGAKSGEEGADAVQQAPAVFAASAAKGAKSGEEGADAVQQAPAVFAASAAKVESAAAEKAEPARRDTRVPPELQGRAAAQLLAHKAALEEQRRTEEQRVLEKRRQEEEERLEREEEERERQRQREEDEALEALKEQKRLEKEREAKEEAERKAQKALEKEQRQAEQARRMEEEKTAFSQEDFEALQAMRAELEENEPEGEESPDELDEDAILDKEIERVKKEEKTSQKKASANLANMLFEMEGFPMPDLQQQFTKVQQAKHRAALKEKLQTRRELESIMNTQGATGRRARR